MGGVFDRRAALDALALGEETACFRYEVETFYAGLDPDECRWGGPPPPVPPAVGMCLVQIAGLARLLADAGGPGALVATDALAGAADERRRSLQSLWCGPDHLGRAERRHVHLDASEGTEQPEADSDALDGTPFDAAGWADYESAAADFGASLSGTTHALFALGRLLGSVVWPPPSGYDAARNDLRHLDPLYLGAEVTPEARRLLDCMRADCAALPSLPDSVVIDAGEAARRVLGAVRDDLARVEPGAGGVPGGSPPALGGADVEAPAPSGPPSDPAPPPAAPPAKPAEYRDLVELKKKIDPNDTYVGQSLAVLRMFEQLEDLNLEPNLPVVILGPSGVGKTHLARLIHDSSTRKGGPFLSLTADLVKGGDANIRRTSWLGYDKKSGLHGLGAGDTKLGWLREAAGGTIFLDELHSLDRDTMDFLRNPMEQKPSRPAMGGDEYLTDVRFVFATFRPIEELVEEKVLPTDFVRRLGGRYLKVPPISQRTGDIPLFAERFRGDRRLGAGFLAALLRHDWSQYQTDGLIKAIRGAVARTPEGQKLEPCRLKGSVPDDILTSLGSMSKDEIDREVYSRLIEILLEQNLEFGGGLQNKLAALLGVNKYTVSRDLKRLGLPADGSKPSRPRNNAGDVSATPGETGRTDDGPRPPGL